MSSKLAILFAGGGSGGHIMPNLAVIDRLAEMGVPARCMLLISHRPLDAQIAEEYGASATALAARPWSARPWHWPGFALAWRSSVAMVRTLIHRYNAAAVIATGGFVSAPALAAGAKAGVRTALVNLDAVPGKANRALAKRVGDIFTAHRVNLWPDAHKIDLPVRRAAIGPDDPGQARRELAMQADRPMLLVCGGSQGAESINHMMLALTEHRGVVAALGRWQILHLTGEQDNDKLTAAYARAGIRAKVAAFSTRMGLAWAGADLAISRGGANSVAEAWVNATPTIFLPYPYHRDEHQRLNVKPLADIGGGVVYQDLIDPTANLHQLASPLISMMTNSGWRQSMVDKMLAQAPSDGAATIAQWIADLLD